MTRRHQVMAAIVLASVAVYAQAGGAQQAAAGGGQGGGGRVQSTADLVVLDGWGNRLSDPGTPGPAPVRDISGMWEPAESPGAGIQANGPVSMPNDGEHEPPFTAEGRRVYDTHMALYGHRAVLPSLSNDPRNKCDPLGFPRANFYQLRHTRFIQLENQVVILYQFNKRYRVIWTDGRDFPAELPDNRWYGYSTGRWEDDQTFVVNTMGLLAEPRTWLDETGWPMSPEMTVEERFHLVNSHLMEITVTVTDPLYYTEPWVPMDRFPMKKQADDYDIIEMLCAPTDMEAYSTDFGDPASGIGLDPP